MINIKGIVLTILLIQFVESCTQYHKVVSGDTCYQISINYGISLDQFYTLNPGINCQLLQIGQKVCVNGGGNDADITYQQFVSAVTSCGYSTPSQTKYQNFMNGRSQGGITTNRELAMFLAQILHESGGLYYMEEIACKTTKCPGSYRSPGDDPNLFYYGRGYIQLTWSYNYRAASFYLFNDDRLVKNPDQVAYDDSIAWKTAYWFWKANVHSLSDVQQGHFGASTKAINGGECNPCHLACPTRFDYYGRVLKAWGINEVPSNIGC